MSEPARPPEPRQSGQQNGWIEVVVEIPRGSRNKYEFDHHAGVFRLDRVLYSSMHYPTDYGFIDRTLSEDGDPLDVLVIVEEPTFPGCHLRVRPIGALDMLDEKGPDEKILGVPVDDPRFAGIIDLGQVQDHWTKEISSFFRTYKELQGLEVEVRGWHGTEHAWQMIRDAQRRFDATQS